MGYTLISLQCLAQLHENTGNPLNFQGRCCALLLSEAEGCGRRTLQKLLSLYFGSALVF